jgi:hypothetical protein
MTRRRTTWTDKKASPPPATPGYLEGTNHPAYPGQDPNADKYMNGDPSSWAEDPHPGPYPNPPPPPADPGMQEPQGHPATDPAHYFPGGAGRAASRDLRAAMEHKASKCIRLATALLGKSASGDMIEDQALDFMHLSDRSIQAAFERLAGTDKKENYTLTPERKADDLLAEDDEKKEAKKSDDEMEEEKEAAKKAAHFRRLAAQWDAVAKGDRKATPSGDQNDPAHYNFEGTDLGKKAGEDEEEEEKMLAEMMEEEAKKKAADSKTSKDEPFGGKKAPPFEKKDDEKKEAKKSEDEEKKSEDEDKEAKKAKKSEDEDKEAKKSEEEEPAKEAKKSEEEESDKEASVAGMLAGMEEPMADDPFGADPLDLMDTDDTGMSPDEMAVIYGGRYAKKSEEEESDKDAKKSEDEDEKKEAKKSEEDEKEALKHVDPKAAKSAAKPQPRTASTGPKTLGTVSGNNRTAANEVNELSKLWESAPDVSNIFR